MKMNDFTVTYKNENVFKKNYGSHLLSIGFFLKETDICYWKVQSKHRHAYDLTIGLLFHFWINNWFSIPFLDNAFILYNVFYTVLL